MNALVLYVGTQAIAYIHSKSGTPSMSTITHSSHMDIFQNLAVDLDTEGKLASIFAVFGLPGENLWDLLPLPLWDEKKYFVFWKCFLKNIFCFLEWLNFPIVPLYAISFHINKQQKFYSLPKRYKQIRRFKQRPFVGN